MTKLPILAAGALLLALAGCSTTPDIQLPLPPAYDADAKFLGLVHDDAPSTEAYADEDLVVIGHQVCDVFDAGADFDTIATAFLDKGWVPEVAGTIIGTAVGVYCPEYVGELS